MGKTAAPPSLPYRETGNSEKHRQECTAGEPVYRYNFFYDNCTTRAREMILSNIGNQSTNFKDIPTTSTREEIHKLNGQHRWARLEMTFFFLGCQADRPITQREWEFCQTI